MDKPIEIKKYNLNPEEIEKMLQTQFGNDIRPVNQNLLQRQRRNQQQQIARNIFLEGKHTETTEESLELEALEELEEIKSL